MASFVSPRLPLLPPPFIRSRSHPLCTTSPPAQRSAPIFVPGKFDALHIGHLSLARVAATLGTPTLLSFSNMAAFLNWPPRPPVVAEVDRSRILRAWGSKLGTRVVYKQLAFADVKDLSPEGFVELLYSEMGAAGVVCGGDWRFGKGKKGGVEHLKKFAEERGMQVRVVDGVHMGGDVVSSTRVREGLKKGHVMEVEQLLGRKHRVVGYVEEVGEGGVWCTGFVNQVPGVGQYDGIVRVIGRKEPFEAEVKVQEDGKVWVRDAEVIYCDDCEVYIDFVDRHT